MPLPAFKSIFWRVKSKSKHLCEATFSREILQEKLCRLHYKLLSVCIKYKLHLLSSCTKDSLCVYLTVCCPRDKIRSMHNDWCYHRYQHVLMSLTDIPQMHTGPPPQSLLSTDNLNYHLHIYGNFAFANLWNTKPLFIKNPHLKFDLQTSLLV